MSSANFPTEVVIGYAGEQNARTIEFDCSEEFGLWPGSIPTVMYVRPGERRENAIYPGLTEVEGNIVKWIPDAFATELEGDTGYVQIFFTDPSNEELLGKSATVKTTVAFSLSAVEEPITPYIPLLTRMTNAASVLEGITVAAETGEETSADLSIVNGHYHLAFSLESGEDGKGISSITKTDSSEEDLTDTYTITFTDGTTTTFFVKNGEKGEKGDPGTLYIGDLNDQQQEELLSKLQWITASDVDDAFESTGLSPAT